MRPLTLICASTIAALAAGCVTAPLVTESSSRAIAKIKQQCAADHGCTISMEDHGDSWWVTTHLVLPPDTLGNDGDTYIVSKRQDRVTKILVSE
jgi:acyl-CoA synthetase (AMP-forming)/AMP-acid ligase II